MRTLFMTAKDPKIIYSRPPYSNKKAILLPGDLGRPAVCKNVASRAIKSLGGIDILVNNAAFQRSYATFADIPEDEFEETYRVNAVTPGPVWTPLIPSTLNRKKVKSFGSNTIFERAAQPAELAPIYVFLASDHATYVSGEIYGATGGRMPI